MPQSEKKALGKFPSRVSNSTGSLNRSDISLELKEIKGLLGKNEIKFINGVWIKGNLCILGLLLIHYVIIIIAEFIQ